MAAKNKLKIRMDWSNSVQFTEYCYKAHFQTKGCLFHMKQCGIKKVKGKTF